MVSRKINKKIRTKPVDRLIQRAKLCVELYNSKPLLETHCPHVSLKVASLDSPSVKRILTSYLKDHSVVGVKTNGIWVCVLFNRT